MSKADGKQIAVKFTMPLLGDVSEPIGCEIGTTDVAINKGIAANSGAYANAFDGNTTSYWYSSGTTVWVVVDLITPTSISLVNLFSNGDGYWSKGCAVEGSADGLAWTPVFQSNYTMIQNATFNLLMPTNLEYRYFKFTFTTQYGALVVTSLEIYPNARYGNEKAFTITGQEYKYINGPILNKTYTVISVVAHPTEPRTLLITVGDFTRFNNVEGQLKVSYNSALGTLVGVGGAVQSFDAYFTPLDLLREINPNDEETVRGTISNATISYDLMSYLNAYHQHTLNANIASAVIEYTDVTIVNP